MALSIGANSFGFGSSAVNGSVFAGQPASAAASSNSANSEFSLQALPRLQQNFQLGQAWSALAGKSTQEDSGALVSGMNLDALQSLYGHAASDIQTLASEQPLTAGQARNLAGSAETLSTVKETLGSRSDLKLEDLTTNNGASLSATMRDPEVRQTLMQRPDLQPKDIQEMNSDIERTFKGLGCGQDAFGKTLTMLGNGAEIKPQQLSRLCDQIVQATGKFPPVLAEQASMGMLDTVGELLKKGKSVEQVGDLLTATKTVAGGEPRGAEKVFDMGAQALEAKSDLDTKQILKLAGSVANTFGGVDPSMRIAAFATGCQLLSSKNVDVSADGIDTMLRRGQDQGLSGEELLRSFQSQAHSIQDGTLDPRTAQNGADTTLKFGKNGELQAAPSPQRTPGHGNYHRALAA